MPKIKTAPGASNALLTLQQAAHQLGYSESHFRKMLRAGIIPCLKVGIGRGSYRVKESDLIAWLNSKQYGTAKTCSTCSTCSSCTCKGGK